MNNYTPPTSPFTQDRRHRTISNPHAGLKLNVSTTTTNPASVSTSVSTSASVAAEDEKMVDELETDSEEEEEEEECVVNFNNNNTTTPNTIFTNLLCAVEIEKKFEASRKEIEAAKALNMQNQKALLEWQKGLKLKESMLFKKETFLHQQAEVLQQKEKDVSIMLQLRENNLKHRETSADYRDVMMANKKARLNIGFKNKKVLAEMQGKCLQPPLEKK